MYAPLFFMEIVNTRGRVKKAKSVSAFVLVNQTAIIERLLINPQIQTAHCTGKQAGEFRRETDY